MPDTTTKDLFTQEEVCTLLKTYPRRFRKIVDQHNIPYRIVGNRRVFDRDSVREACLHVRPLKPGRQTHAVA